MRGFASKISSAFLIAMLVADSGCNSIYTYQGPGGDDAATKADGSASDAADGASPYAADAADANQSLSENFDSADANMSTNGYGAWQISNGVLRQTSCTSNIAAAMIAPKQIWTNFTATVRVRPDANTCATFNNNSQAALIIRIAENQGCTAKYYACVFDITSSSLMANRISSNCVSNGTPVSKSISQPQYDTWYNLSATASGKNITCSFWQTDPAQAVQVALSDDDSGGYITSGSVGVGAYNLPASFDDLVVTAK